MTGRHKGGKAKGKSKSRYNLKYGDLLTLSCCCCCCSISLQSVLIEQTSTPEECNRGSRAIPETIRKSRRIMYKMIIR